MPVTLGFLSRDKEVFDYLHNNDKMKAACLYIQPSMRATTAVFLILPGRPSFQPLRLEHLIGEQGDQFHLETIKTVKEDNRSRRA